MTAAADPTLAARILLTLGGIFILGLVTDLAGRRTSLPRVTLLLLAGFSIGPSALDLLPDFSAQWFPVLTHIALVMVGFLLGDNLTLAALKRRGRSVLVLSLGEVLGVALVMSVGLMLLGVSPIPALLLAGIAPASAPAATLDVIRELRAEGEFSRTIQGIVAIDDAWGLIVFSLLLAAAQGLVGEAGALAIALHGVREVGGALLLGVGLGLPMAFLTGRVERGEPTQAEALGLVLLCGGLAAWFEVSAILAAMVMGAVVASVGRHHRRAFSAIEGIEWPFMILFFVLAGASLHVDALLGVGAIGAAYILLRIAGLVGGAWLAGAPAGVPPATRRWVGVSLLPQAGVALGLVLLATQEFPSLRDTLLPLVIGATVVFEIVGPVALRLALRRQGEGVPAGG